MYVQLLSHVQLFVTLWTAPHRQCPHPRPRSPPSPSSAQGLGSSELPGGAQGCLPPAPGAHPPTAARAGRSAHLKAVPPQLLPQPPLRLQAGVWGPPGQGHPEAESDLTHEAPLPCRRRHRHRGAAAAQAPLSRTLRTSLRPSSLLILFCPLEPTPSGASCNSAAMWLRSRPPTPIPVQTLNPGSREHSALRGSTPRLMLRSRTSGSEGKKPVARVARPLSLYWGRQQRGPPRRPGAGTEPGLSLPSTGILQLYRIPITGLFLRYLKFSGIKQELTVTSAVSTKPVNTLNSGLRKPNSPRASEIILFVSLKQTLKIPAPRTFSLVAHMRQRKAVKSPETPDAHLLCPPLAARPQALPPTQCPRQAGSCREDMTEPHTSCVQKGLPF